MYFHFLFAKIVYLFKINTHSMKTSYTVRWGGKAGVWSWPLTKIRVLMYFLVLNSIFGSKYPIFGKPITIKFQKTFFQAVSTKKSLFTRADLKVLSVSVKSTILPNPVG